MRRVWFFCIAAAIAALVALNWHRIAPRLPESSPRSASESASREPTVTPSFPPPPPSGVPVAAADSAKTTAPASTTTADPVPSTPAPPAPREARQPASAPAGDAQTLIARTLADASDEALSKLKPDTLKQLADALPSTGNASSSQSTQDGDAPQASTVVSSANGVEVRALTPPPPPTALPAGGGDAATTAKAPSTRPAVEDERAKAIRLILAAPAAELEDVPVLLLAKALSEIDTDKLTATDSVQLPAALTAARQELKLETDARSFVAELTRPTLQPIAVADADHFVRPSQKLDLGLEALPPVKTLDELLAAGAGDDQIVTRVRITHRLEPIKPADLLVRATRSPGAPIRILEREQITEIPLAEALRRHQLQPSAPMISVRTVRVLEPTTIAELRQLARLKPGELPRVVAGDPAATQRTVEDLLGITARDSRSLYYVRTVQRQDIQGIWGIIQSGLIDNFARGMAISRGDRVDTYRVHIPRLADEPLADNRGSSFLGRMIFRKMRRSTIYNIRQGRIADNPENIMPGQQIVIVDFSPEELVSIYRHFAKRAAQ